ncbi:MAG: AMP-binding protein [Planctomycetes bacterium]|nr:AMP-binding protein [Planctomycetota bacterium]
MVENQPVSASHSIASLIEAGALGGPGRVAVSAPGRTPLTYQQLFDLLRRLKEEFRAAGIGRNDRVAIVLPNGPELATAFLAAAACATAAPLNPDYREPEFEFYLSDLKARALLVMEGLDSPARRVAEKLGITLLEIAGVPEQPAGTIVIRGPQSAGDHPADDFAQPDDVALLLHTSGTTSRPKLVPLTQRNLCCSAGHIAQTLGLTPDDRSLNMMPLFHIHGLAAATLASLVAGASFICTPGWDQGQFVNWLETLRPTWYSAVPTIHQAVLGVAKRGLPAAHSLRFIRSSSSALAPQLLHELEAAFHVPVIEAYGMTEAAHQMCSNPLPPLKRKPGSVGLAAGPDVAIMNEAGDLLNSGEIGEIVIRGPNVTAGYEQQPAANEAAFCKGWFRTGDQGYCDADGYVFITGRIKELINRGGEKIAPREIDEVLLSHPGVSQAVAFAVPHPRLGEDVAAAVVPREPGTLSERELRTYAIARLSPQKVPSRVIVVPQIPKGPTGKLQRIGLHKAFESLLKVEFTPPASPLEEALARIWSEVLELPRVGRLDNFFMLGGDSLLAMRVLSRVRALFEIELSVAELFEAAVLAEQAEIVEDRLVDADESENS